MTDELRNWERWPVAALFVASGLYIAEWYAGARLGTVAPAWLVAWASTLGGLAAALAVDGAMIATVAGMRAGRRGPWSYAAIVVTALFGSSVALVLHGALPAWVGAWLHAGFVVSAAVYLLHLAQPAQRARTEAADVQHITQAVQVNIALPRTLAAYIQARAAELPQHTPPALAAELGTSPDTVRRALALRQEEA